MKTIISVSFCCFLSLFYLACNKSDDSVNKINLGETFELRFDERLEINDANIAVHFQNVEDSRCPETTIDCFWEGQVEVELSVEIDEDDFVVELIDRVNHPQLAEVEIGDRKVRLVSVEPAKLTEVVIEKDEYVITLVIEE